MNLRKISFAALALAITMLMSLARANIMDPCRNPGSTNDCTMGCFNLSTCARCCVTNFRGDDLAECINACSEGPTF